MLSKTSRGRQLLGSAVSCIVDMVLHAIHERGLRLALAQQLHSFARDAHLLPPARYLSVHGRHHGCLCR